MKKILFTPYKIGYNISYGEVKTNFYRSSTIYKKMERSGSVRVCYTDFEEYEVTYLITAFTKNEQDNLSSEEKNVLKKLVKALKEEAAKNRR